MLPNQQEAFALYMLPIESLPTSVLMTFLK